jgi:hypothetical protein
LLGEKPCAEEIANHSHPIGAVETAEKFHIDKSPAGALPSIGCGDEDLPSVQPPFAWTFRPLMSKAGKMYSWSSVV